MSRVSVVLCEGYHDRAFWYGWLESLNCRFDRRTALPPIYGRAAGEYSGKTPGDNFVSIIPVGGDSQLLQAAETRLTTRLVKPIHRLVVNLDPDYEAGSTPTGIQPADLLAFARRFDPAAAQAGDEVAVDGGGLMLSLVRWELRQPTPPQGVPTKQTLERLVSMAMQRAYPERAEDVQNWLNSRRNPADDSVKAFAWSYMAGWFPESGCEDFFRSLWRDAAVRTQLIELLKGSNAWSVGEALAQ